MQTVQNNVYTDAYSEQDLNDNLLCRETLGASFEGDRDEKINTLWQNVQATINNAQEAFRFDQDSAAFEQSQSELEPLVQCPVCLKTETMQKACLPHIKNLHPDFKFMCRLCFKEFCTYSAKYCYEKDPKPPSHFCLHCGKGFLCSPDSFFPSSVSAKGCWRLHMG